MATMTYQSPDQRAEAAAYGPPGARFPTVQFQPGYDIATVDAFRHDRVALGLRDPQRQPPPRLLEPRLLQGRGGSEHRVVGAQEDRRRLMSPLRPETPRKHLVL